MLPLASLLILYACASSSSMIKSSGYYSEGAKKYYFTQGIFYDIKSQSFEMDSESFRVVQRTTPGYAIDKNFVYIGGSTIKGADPQTFVVMNRDYTKDHRHVFYKGEIVSEAMPTSFSLIKAPSWSQVEQWGRDEKFAFFRGQKQVICDVKTLTVLKGGWAKDRECVYGGYVNKLDVLDASTFEDVNEVCGKDAHGYWIFFTGSIRKSTKEECAKFN